MAIQKKAVKQCFSMKHAYCCFFLTWLNYSILGGEKDTQGKVPRRSMPMHSILFSEHSKHQTDKKLIYYVVNQFFT